MKRVAIFLTGPAAHVQNDFVRPFKEAMTSLKWVEGTDIAYEIFDSTKPLRTPDERLEHAQKLIAKEPPPDLMWVISTESAEAIVAARQAKQKTTPIVGSAVSSLFQDTAKAAGNVACVYNNGWELGPERYRNLKQLMPNLKRVGVLVNPRSASSVREFEKIKQAAGADVVTTRVDVADDDDLGKAFADLKQAHVQAVMTTHVPLFQTIRRDIVARAKQQEIPVVGHRRLFVNDGALMDCSCDLADQMRDSANMVDKILRGTKAGQIQPGPNNSVVTIKGSVASSYGLTVPQAMQNSVI